MRDRRGFGATSAEEAVGLMGEQQASAARTSTNRYGIAIRSRVFSVPALGAI
jgi:hypothetical protein